MSNGSVWVARSGAVICFFFFFFSLPPRFRSVLSVFCAYPCCLFRSRENVMGSGVWPVLGFLGGRNECCSIFLLLLLATTIRVLFAGLPLAVGSQVPGDIIGFARGGRRNVEVSSNGMDGMEIRVHGGPEMIYSFSPPDSPA
ncbi:hypothetical protein BDV59DRAFT_167138 [Aspergillus ambiguus]|uniref:uncharacterized protein n=1 Tax=Aspergillus ambiguus TaxID=176160 RepID=UPI003CCDB0B4